MCGICGIAFSDRSQMPDPALIARMTGALVHRGPDSEGIHAAPGVGLGIRRLSIIDVEHGDQPIANEDGSVIVVCNGEIYNHVELRRQLSSAGHVFRTRSDVEVIVHLYEEHGADFMHHLRGMFAIALWDARERKLLLVRDRLGIKPLHYALTPSGLMFASEQKALLVTGEVAPDPDLVSVAQVFSYGRVVGDRTMVRDVRRLRAGHCLSYSGGDIRIRQYWDAIFPSRHDYDNRTTPREWAAGLHDKLAESVRLHVRSDVPVGAWLSAGIDSSAVTALMSRITGPGIPTFTLRFADEAFDEFTGQKGLDDYPEYGLDGHRVLCDSADLARLPLAVWHGEDTLMADILVGQMIVAKATARHVKVALTGEGSDEILGGYSWYKTLRVLQPAFALPSFMRHGIAGIPWVRRRWPGAASVIAGERAMTFERFSRSITHLRGQAADSLLFADGLMAHLGEQPTEFADAAIPSPPGFDAWHPFAQMQYFDLKHRLADAVVMGLDRSSMAYSVEARVPFLDHEVVEFCARIPPRVKMKWLTEKHVLRLAMRKVLPRDIVHRRKHAMQVPGDVWMRGPLPPFAEALLSESALRDKGYFDPRRVAAARERHRAGHENLGKVLLAVLGFQLWDELFRCARPVAEIV